VLKKTITYTDFSGEEVTEDFFFHLSKAELIELEMSVDGGLSEMMKKIIATEDGRAIMEQFKKIILMAYGKKSEDGKRFIKNSQLREEFASSEAYSELFMELCTNADAANEFVNGMIPQGLQDALDEAQLKQPRKLTEQELREMPHDELILKLRNGEVSLP
jgi:hypothetical protein